MTDQPTPGAPMLSDEDANVLLDGALEKQGDNDPAGMSWLGMEVTRDFYEAKITSGELRVVKTIKRSEVKDHVLSCKENMADAMDTYFYNYILFCPGCGAEIVER